jgi:cold shock CspA family protein
LSSDERGACTSSHPNTVGSGCHIREGTLSRQTSIDESELGGTVNMGETWGRVRSYDSTKGYGFITGDDGLNYFFHITDMTGDTRIAVGHRVTFEPSASKKGPRARHVVVQGKPPRSAIRTQAVYSDPDRFIMTREPAARGYEIVRVIAEGCWYEAYDPNQAKEGLKEQAITWGANAIVGLHLEKYSKSPYPLWARIIGAPNYYQTMHRFYGTAVVIKKRIII